MKHSLILIFFLISSTYALSCSCGGVGIKENFNQSDVIFKGRLKEKKEITSIEKTTFNTEIEYKRYEFKFEVVKKYKGLIKKEPVTIITTAGGADCGNDFKKGKTYLIYSYKSDTKLLSPLLLEEKTDEYLTTNLCTRTKETNLLTFMESFILAVL